MAMTNEQLTKWIDEIFGTIDEIKQNSGDISGLTRSVKQLREDLTATQEDVSDLETDTAGTVSMVKAALQHFTDGSATQALDLVADIIPMQAGTGDPSPTNVRAITGYSSVTASDFGFNQWNEDWEEGDYNGTNGNKLSDNTRIRTKNPIRVFPGTTIYIKMGYDSNLDLFLYNASGAYIGAAHGFIQDKANTTFTIPENVSFLNFSTKPSYGNTYRNDICINFSKTEGTPKNGDYVPYDGTTATFSLGYTVYGGSVNFTTGALEVTRGSVDLGDLNWYTYNADAHIYYSDAIATATNSEFMCDSYKSVQVGVVTQLNDKEIVLAGNMCLYVKDMDIASASDFKTASDGVMGNFKLAAPTTTTLTPAQLSLLQGENNVSATSGPITLTYAPDNVLAEVYAYIQKRFDTLTASLAANRTTRKTTKTLTKKED